MYIFIYKQKSCNSCINWKKYSQFNKLLIDFWKCQQSRVPEDKVLSTTGGQYLIIITLDTINLSGLATSSFRRVRIVVLCLLFTNRWRRPTRR